ncbi:MAG TPA: circularly permuted type 2 ATP-grasp protein [Draconibacterium sp.]|nr:circularly permuted type 2 ATP-grasp protein [Draconibacterium sp.]HRX11427.1 circularly permuted type 2 ATP-grasp protein [Draconibacterium sp.]
MEQIMNGILDSQKFENLHFDEVYTSLNDPKDHYKTIVERFNQLSISDFQRINNDVKTAFFNQGITFAVYSEDNKANERIFPFDLFPRIIPNDEWMKLEKGVIQRNKAINLFLHDIYHKKFILKDKVVPADLIFSSKNYLKEMVDFTPEGGIYTHISGTDLIKHTDGEYYILEDNLRCPSGVSYVLSNRMALKKSLFELFNKLKVKTVYQYPEHLLEILKTVKPANTDTPNVVVVTPGMYNSAYFEHSFLAQKMGVSLVEGRDLYVEKDFVFMKTIRGPQRVDVIYRRVDDEFIDPLCFRKDSMLGVPGLMNAYRAGNVTLANAPGTGVADDKAVYNYVPDIIKYYLGEEPILNNVRTYRCEREDDMKYVLENIDKLVVKPVDESGGYGITIGTTLTRGQIEEVKVRIKDTPRKYIAQPIMSLSVHPTFIEETSEFEPRHIDLRTFSLMGKNTEYILKGGLTRVALKRGNLIVNSSQGGGSKDTWVLD